MKQTLHKQGGFTLIEVLISMALLGIIATAFLVAVSTATKATFITDERATAESIARSQLEYIKQQDYLPADPNSEAIYTMITIDTNAFPEYTIWSYNRDNELTEDIIGIPWDTQSGIYTDIDGGVQNIVLVIKHYDDEIFTIEGLKAER